MTPESLKKICVFCGSSYGTKPEFQDFSAELGKLMASKKYGLVYGGGTTGLMGVIAKSVASNGGYVHGIIPDALVSKERVDDAENFNKKIQESVDNHHGSTPIPDDGSYGKTTVVKDMHTRKRLMSTEADAFVAMPGGYGTLEEIMEITTWSQLGIHKKPIVLFNIDGFYDDFIKFLDTAVKSGFISAKNADILVIATTPEEVIEAVDNYVIPEGRFNLTWENELSTEKST